MGFIKDAKAGTLGEQAKKAAEAGRTVFVARLNVPMSHHGMSGSVPDWAEMIEAIEAHGWKLDRWAVTDDEKGRPEAYPLFRRR